MIRPAAPDEYATLLGLREAIDPLTASTVEDMRAFDEQAEAPLRLLAEEGGRGVGLAWAMRFPDEEASGLVGVLPEARGRGIGAALLDAIVEHARVQAWPALRLSVAEGPAEAWLERRGFALLERLPRVVLELPNAACDNLSQAEVELTDLAQRPELLRSTFDLLCAGLEDVPGALARDEQTWESWVVYQSAPSRRPEFVVVALDGGEPVGFAQLNVYPRVGFHGFTTVARPYRGRGIARALKLELIRRARARRLERLITMSNEDNVAMRTLNASLGYRDAPALVALRRAL